MQTFLPDPSFHVSARCLDRKRLGKQRVEVLQILRANLGIKSGWRNHPASKMWKGHESALSLYGVCICAEWIRRGYKDGCMEKIALLGGDALQTRLAEKALEGEEVFTDRGWPFTFPPWIGDPRFHASHKSKLMAKAPDHYEKFHWAWEPGLPYFWPTKHPDYAEHFLHGGTQ